jgi:hypothetical protein
MNGHERCAFAQEVMHHRNRQGNGERYAIR